MKKVKLLITQLWITLNEKTIEEILNEIFSTDVDENEQEMENFRKEYDL